MKPFLWIDKTFLFALPGLALALANCQGPDEPATQTRRVLRAAATQAAQSPAQQARAAAWQAATTRPAPLPAGTPADLRPALTQLLPPEGYLQLVSVQLTKPAQPAVLALPVLWRPVKGGYPPVAPGYRLSYEAVLRWQPTGFAPGQKVPAALSLREPSAQDSLAGYSLTDEPITGPSRPWMQPGQTVRVRGTLYAYAATAHARPALVVFPYRDPAGVPDPRKLITLPL